MTATEQRVIGKAMPRADAPAKLTGQERYADVIERILFNVVATSLGDDGRSFFYANTLHQRSAPPVQETQTEQLQFGGGLRAPWFEVSCCLPNMARLLGSLAGYVSSVDSAGLRVHQFTDADITTPRYSKLQSGADGELEFCINAGESLFLVVVGTPSVQKQIVWDQMYNTIHRYPWMVELAGAGGGTLLRPIGGQYAPAGGASQPAGSFWGVGSDGGPTGDWTNWRRTAPSVGGQWACLEWRMSAANGEIDVWIDGVAKPELSVTKTMHGGTQVDFVFPAIDRAWFGWWLYQANPTPSTYEVWLDDLALGSDRLGCE